MALDLDVRKALALIEGRIFSQPRLICSRSCDFRIGDQPVTPSFRHTHTASTGHALDWRVNGWVPSNSIVKQDHINAVMQFQVFGLQQFRSVRINFQLRTIILMWSYRFSPARIGRPSACFQHRSRDFAPPWRKFHLGAD